MMSEITWTENNQWIVRFLSGKEPYIGIEPINSVTRNWGPETSSAVSVVRGEVVFILD